MWEDMSGAAEDVELNWGSKRIHLSQISRWGQYLSKTSNIIKYQDELNICANITEKPLSIFAQNFNLSTNLLSNIKENPIWAKYQEELNICANILANPPSIFAQSFQFVKYIINKYWIQSTWAKYQDDLKYHGESTFNFSTALILNIKENPIWAKYQDELNICTNIMGSPLSIFAHSFHFVN